MSKDSIEPNDANIEIPLDKLERVAGGQGLEGLLHWCPSCGQQWAYALYFYAEEEPPHKRYM